MPSARVSRCREKVVSPSKWRASANISAPTATRSLRAGEESARAPRRPVATPAALQQRNGPGKPLTGGWELEAGPGEIIGGLTLLFEPTGPKGPYRRALRCASSSVKN